MYIYIHIRIHTYKHTNYRNVYTYVNVYAYIKYIHMSIKCLHMSIYGPTG